MLRLVLLSFLLFPSIAFSQNANWGKIEGGKAVDGEFVIKCEDNKGWSKCGEEDKERLYFVLRGSQNPKVGERSYNFNDHILKGKISYAPSDEGECRYNSYAWYYGYWKSHMGWECHDTIGGMYIDGYGDSEWVTLSPLYKAKPPKTAVRADSLIVVYEKISSTPPEGIVTCSQLGPAAGYHPFREKVDYKFLEICDPALKYQSIQSKKAKSFYSLNSYYPKIPYFPTVRVEGLSNQGKKYKIVRLVAASTSANMNISSNIDHYNFVFEIEEE